MVTEIDVAEYAAPHCASREYYKGIAGGRGLRDLTGGCVEEGRVMCPRHGAWFDIRTGEALTPPAYEPVATFPVRIHDGTVQIRDDRND